MMTTRETHRGDDLPWIEKYRPQRIQDVVHQEPVKRMLQQVVKTRNMPHCLFYGPPGTGKTSIALALCRELFGHELWSKRVMELNASDDRGIAVVREKIKRWTRTAVGGPFMSGDSLPSWKVVILDEADLMTGDAQSALRRIMEDNAKTTRFIIICNYLSKIIDPIASRCAKYRFEPISRDAQMMKLNAIAEVENTKFTVEAMNELLNISEGDLRVAVMLLQSCSALYDASSSSQEPLTADVVQVVGGFPPPAIAHTLFESSIQSRPDSLVALQENITAEAWDVKQLLRQLLLVTINSSRFDEVAKSVVALAVAETEHRLTHGALESLQLLHVITVINREAQKIEPSKLSRHR